MAVPRAPRPPTVEFADPVQASYYDAAYAAPVSAELARIVDADLRDSRDPVETLRRYLSYAFARGAAFGKRERIER